MARLLAWSSLETEDTFAAIWYVLLVGEVREYAHSCSEVDLHTRMKAQALPIAVEEEVDADIACVLGVGEFFFEPRALGIDEGKQSSSLMSEVSRSQRSSGDVSMLPR